MSTGVSSKIYLGSSEFILDNSGSINSSRTFITAPTGICAVWEKVGSANGALHYIHTDNQGSWLKITSESGTVENTYSYDAWGRPRNPSTWALKPISITNALGNLNDMQPRFDRGYTGHEHMAGFGLINMNGRLYDPYLQRFLSPDPFVQSPNNAQNYNRYTYCLNNPLAYTDPTGYNQKELMDNGFKLSDLGYDMKGGSGVIKEYLNRGGGPAAGSLGYVYNWDGTYTDKATGKTASYKIVYKYVSPYIWKDCGTYTEGKNGELVSLGGHGRIWSENPDFHRIPAKNVGNLSNEPKSEGGPVITTVGGKPIEWWQNASGRVAEDHTIEAAVIGGTVGTKGIIALIKFLTPNQSSVPKPSPNFRTPTNSPQLPPSEVPAGFNLRIMQPTEQYPNGYWIMEKPMPQGGFQGINPSTMRPGPRWDTHVPLPFGYWPF